MRGGDQRDGSGGDLVPAGGGFELHVVGELRFNLLWRLFRQERDQVPELFRAEQVLVVVGHDGDVAGGKRTDVAALDGGGFADAFGDEEIFAVSGDQAGEDVAVFQFDAVVDVVGI